MKAVTRYIAVDGSQWNTEAEALTRDALCSHVEAALALLKARPTDAGFDGGASFVQQESGPALAAKQRIVDLARVVTGAAVFANNAEDIHPQSSAGRILADVGGPLASAWWRFACIDDSFREWGQPYFRSNPNEKATAV